MAPRQPRHTTNVCGLKKSQHTAETREKTLLLTTAVSLRKVVLNTPSDLHIHTDNKNRRTQTNSNSRSEKSLQTTLTSFETSACRSHSFFLFPHHIPLLYGHSPSTVSGNPAARPHAFPGTTDPGQCGRNRDTLASAQSSKKGTPFRLINFAR